MKKKIILKITGMHCTSCAFNIDGELEDTNGVFEAKTNYAKSQTEVTYDPDDIAENAIIDVIHAVGYRAAPLRQTSD